MRFPSGAMTTFLIAGTGRPIVVSGAVTVVPLKWVPVSVTRVVSPASSFLGVMALIVGVGRWIFRLTVSVRTRPPAVPVIVKVWFPSAATAPALTDNTAVPPTATLAGWTDAVTPAGAPLTVSVAFPAKP